ncbi:MAG: PQQ-binding-like beta-propeller repeat protein [Acidobacteriota bacterium]
MRIRVVALLVAAAGCGDSGGGNGNGNGATGASVVQHHKDAARDGVYVDAAFTKAAAPGIHADPAFSATISGPTYAQPLFVEAGIAGKDVLVVATERNIVYALDAATGAVIWQTQPLGAPVRLADLPCGNIDPLGITGTPYIDVAAGTIYLGAMTTPDGGATKKHEIYAIALADGSVKPGWPVDVEAAVPGFMSDVQNQRGAVLVEGGVLYVPYGGHYGDCGNYHGWLVGVNVSDPTKVMAWSTAAQGGGAWSAGGVSSDGTSMYVTTGNTFGASTWGGGDAVIRLAKGPAFSGAAADYFAPANWMSLDSTDTDMGTHALVSAPGLAPSSLVAAFGKDGNIYLMDHANLGGIGHELATFHAGTGEITGAVTTYTTGAGTFIAFRIDGGTGTSCPGGTGGNMAAVKLAAGTPPTVAEVWCARESDQSLPITSMTDPSGSDAIVWNMGAQLYGYDAETGAELFHGGTLANVRYFQTPIIAKGRLYVAGDARVYAFTL